MSKPTIAIYTPMKNEELHVERWITAHQDADELLILDTGSTDDTIAIAEQHQWAKVATALIEPFRFDDARNTALALISPDIDIVLQVDADEVLCEGWRDIIDSIDLEAGHTRWSYWLDSAGHGTWGRVLRKNMHTRTGYRWECPVHEAIAGPEPTQHLDNLVIEHHPDESKPRTYVTDLLRYWNEREPKNARLAFYLGRELLGLGDWTEARKVLTEYLTMGVHPGERSEAYLYIGQMDFNPPRWYHKAVSEAPERREPYVFLAHHYAKHYNYKLASIFMDLAAQRTDRSIFTTHNWCWDEPFDKLRAAIDQELRVR